MKHQIVLLCLLGTVLLTGCGGKSERSDWREERPDWRVVSAEPEDFGISYDGVEDLGDYPLDKLTAYCLGADGVYAEGAFDECCGRLIEAPRTWVAYVSLLQEEDQARLCEQIATVAAAWYENDPEFSETLSALEKADLTGAEQATVSLLLTEYNSDVG